MNLRNEDGLSRAAAASANAREIAARFAEAHAGLAGGCTVRATDRPRDSVGETPDDIGRGRSEAKRALEPDEPLWEALAALGFLLLMTNDFAQSEAAFVRALARTPRSAPADCWYAIWREIRGWRDQSGAAYAKAVELTPLWFINPLFPGAKPGLGRAR